MGKRTKGRRAIFKQVLHLLRDNAQIVYPVKVSPIVGKQYQIMSQAQRPNKEVKISYAFAHLPQSVTLSSKYFTCLDIYVNDRKTLLKILQRLDALFVIA
jgi:hypothetical protein